MLCNEAEQMQQQNMLLAGGMNPLASSGWLSVMAGQRVPAVQAGISSSGGAAGRNKHAVNIRHVVQRSRTQ